MEKGAGAAISRWAGGNIAKKYIATTVAKKAISEARKMSLGESKDWRAAFKKDPGEALRSAAVDYVQTEVRDAFAAKRPEINQDLILTYTDTLINKTGDSIVQATQSAVGKSDDLIVRFDQDKLIDRTSSEIIRRGLKWTEDKDVIGGTSQILDRNVIGGSSQILDRSVIGGTSQILNKNVIGNNSDLIEYKNYQEYTDRTEEVNRISTADIIESAGKTAFYDSFDEANLTYTVIGPDDALRGKVLSPLEAILEKAFDINEPVSL